MSAGGLTYSMITNHGKVTLPSIEGWSSNMNILRDPPKSYYTRRIDKVGQTSNITGMIDESSDRACEAINVYARGVNPFVSVDYGNNGNNGGQRSIGNTVSIGSGEAKLPYSVMRDGAFRPPVLLQEDLVPLSRMPRNWTSAYSQPGFTDFSRKMRTCGTAKNTREVHTDSLKACVRPTATYRLDKPVSEPFEIKYVIQPSIKTSANSGMRTLDITQQNVQTPYSKTIENPLHARAQANFVGNKYVNNNQFDKERYIQEIQHKEARSNISSKKHRTNIEDILDLSKMPVHDSISTTNVQAPISGNEKNNYIHQEIGLKRRLPEYNAYTNTRNNSVHKRIVPENTIQLKRNMPNSSFTSNPIAKGFSDHSSRKARLAEKINPGSFSVPGSIPMSERMENGISVHTTDKERINRIVSQEMKNRYSSQAPFSM